MVHQVTPIEDREHYYTCSCGRVFASMHPVVACPDAPEKLLPLIGHDRMLIQDLARRVRNEGGRGHDLTRLRETADGRGFYFEAHLRDAGGKLTSRVARVTVALDRVYRYCATHGRQHDDDGDRTCRWE
jgi:hypothetical protein